MVAEVFGRSIDLLKKHVLAFGGVALAVGAAYGLFGFIYTSAFGDMLLTVADGGEVSDEDYLRLFWFGTLGGLVVGAIALVCNAAMVAMASQADGGDAPDVADAFQTVWSRIWTLVGSMLLVMLTFIGITFVGMFTIIVAALAVPALALIGAFALMGVMFWLGVYIAPLVPVVMAEGLGAFDSIKRCFALVKGRWWTVFGTLILVGIVGFLAGLIGNFIPGTVGLFVSIVVSAALFAFNSAAVYFIYVVLRHHSDLADAF